jgi:signal transduction histidine kinase
MDAIGQLAGGVAHDFNNMLTAMMGWSHLAIAAIGETGAGHNEIREIEKAALRAADLTTQLLAFSRRQALTPRIVDLNLAIAEGAALLKRLLPPAVVLEVGVDRDVPLVEVDPTQLQQILMNLVLNARDAMPSGGVITLVTRRSRSGAELLVSDTGIGMDDATRAQIFDPFFTTKPPGEGTGLGLSTVYGIVLQSRASIDVATSPGVGTTFVIRFPLVAQAKGESAA